MKKVLCFLISFCFILSMTVCAFAVSDGFKTDGNTVILLSATPTEQERFSAGKLREFIAASTGRELPVVNSATGNYIAVGRVSDIDASDIATNGYRIKEADGNVHIVGTGIRGTVAGVYRFAEEFCGRKVYTSSLTVTEKKSDISVPAGTDIVYEPYFEYTDTDWRSPRNVEYSITNGLNGNPYRSIPAYMGGTVEYIGSFCHTLTRGFCSEDKYFDAHPEYFALRDGKREPTQLCLTNPEVLQIVTSEVLEMLKKYHKPDASLQIVSLTQDDNRKYCQCENCAAFERAYGDVRSATMINFVNQVADAVKAAGYDNVAIDTFAYQYTRKAPTGIVPRDNVIVRLCTIECCFSHALNDPNCENNAELKADLEEWSKICNRIYVWDYTTNYDNTCCVFPDFGVIQKNIQFFYEHNVKGVYEEGNYYINECDAEFGELRAYMISKCLQDPYCDLESEVNGFLAAYYGPGWEYIRSALDMYTENAGDKNGHLEIYQDSNISMTLSDARVNIIDSYWLNAANAAETEEQYNNVKRSELSWRYWKASAQKGEFSVLNPDRFNKKEELFNDLQSFGVKRLGESQRSFRYTDCGAVRYVEPDKWPEYMSDYPKTYFRNMFGKIYEMAVPFLSAFGLFYKIKNIVNSQNPIC